MKPQMVVVGSLNADFVIRVDRFPVPGETLTGSEFKVFPGGKGGNQACGAAKLGSPVSMIGQVGNDAQGPWLKDHLSSVGVDVAQVRTDPMVSSGIAAITIAADGQNEIIIVPGANGSFTPERLELSRTTISQAGIVLLQLEIPLETVERAALLAREAGAIVILDPAPARKLPDSLLAMADFLTPNETELAILAGAPSGPLDPGQAVVLAKRLLGRGARRVLVKLGAQGALLVTPKTEQFWPAIPVKAVDSTAAGDAFNAAFAVALARGNSEIEAGQFASAAAACSVQRAGAQPSMPTNGEVQACLSNAAPPALHPL